MDSKRKANGNVVVETDDRGSKRRKVAVSYCSSLGGIALSRSLDYMRSAFT